MMALTGLTFRQLDYLARTRSLGKRVSSPGTGSQRLWSPELLNRILAAKALADVVPDRGDGGGSLLPVFADFVLKGPPPSGSFVYFDGDQVAYYFTAPLVTSGIVARWCEHMHTTTTRIVSSPDYSNVISSQEKVW
jgi:hypothetical protein